MGWKKREMTLDYLPGEYKPVGDSERWYWRKFQMNEKFIAAWGFNKLMECWQGFWSRRTLRPINIDKVCFDDYYGNIFQAHPCINFTMVFLGARFEHARCKLSH